MKQKVMLSAIRKMFGAELLLSAALMPAAYAQTSPAVPASGAAATSSTPAATDSTITRPKVDATATKLEKVEVTGSLIRSSDKADATKTIQTVTAAQIAESGYTTVADFLRGTSINDGNSWSSSSPQTTAPGGSGIALRGLSEKYTLVLVDGQRVANYAKAVNFTDTFFDLNSIPLNSIDHIEIVKTGAVSEYGSDAIAGVVNIITKKNFKGLELSGDFGKAQQPGDAQGNFGVLAGFGDLNSDRFNVTGSASWYRDTGSLLSDREFTKDLNFPANETGTPGLISTTNQQSFFKTPNGNVPLAPCPPGTDTSRDPTSCSANIANSYSLIPSTTRLNAKVRATVQVTDNTQAYIDFWGSRDEQVQFWGPANISSNSNVFVNGVLSPLNRTVPASNPFNPFGVATPISNTFFGTNEGVDTISTFWKASTGLKGTYSLPYVGDWDWNANYGHSQSVVETGYSNVISAAGAQNILQNGTFNFSNPASTPNGLAGVFTTDSEIAVSKLDSVTATTSNANLFNLPGGPVGVGFGTEFRHESNVITSPTLAGLGLVAPARIQNVDGERNVAAVYYQADIPIFHTLTFTQSGRYDHYSDFGGAFSPNFALRFQPLESFTAYASYGRGFRAPTAVENSQSAFVGHQTLNDPHAPAGSPSENFTSEVNLGNPKLQPEHTTNTNIGFVLSPDRNTDFGAAFYNVKIDGVIGTADPQALLNANDPGTVVRNADGTISFINMQFLNLGSLKTDGFDFNFRRSLPTTYGTFTLTGDWTWVWHFKLEDQNGQTTDFAGNNLAFNQPFGASNPRWKGNTTASWAYRDLTTSLTWQYTAPYTDALSGVGTGSVASYSQFNLYATYKGIKHWTIYGGINNVFNKAPPFDPNWTFAPDTTGYDQTLYTDIGRFFQVGGTYRF